MNPVTRILSALEGLRGGQLHLALPDGSRQVFGAGDAVADLRLRDWSALPLVRALGLDGMGRAHAAGLWDTSAIEPLVTLALQNRDRLGVALQPGPVDRLRDSLMRRRLSRAAMPGNEFFLHWLDAGMEWSTGQFAADDDDLDRAQARKHDRILRQTGPDVLDIGCGWGAFAERAAGAGRSVTALAGTGPQKAYADARLDGRAQVVQGGPGAVSGQFASVVAIEPEVTDWPAFLAQAAQRMAEGGQIVMQVVTVPDAEYTLQGRGALPSPAILARAAAQAGLQAGPMHGFGADAAKTHRIWADRLRAAAPRLMRHGFDAPFLRQWQFALESRAARFALGLREVVQVDMIRA